MINIGNEFEAQNNFGRKKLRRPTSNKNLKLLEENGLTVDVANYWKGYEDAGPTHLTSNISLRRKIASPPRFNERYMNSTVGSRNKLR